MKYIPTTTLVADTLTKALPKVSFWDKIGQMCLAEKKKLRKRKSLMSKVVVPKKFNLNL